MAKKFCDIHVGDVVYYIYPRYDYFETCELKLIEKKSNSEYLFRRELCGDGYMNYGLEIHTASVYSYCVYGKDKPFLLFASKENFLSGLKRLRKMLDVKIKRYERE